MKRQVYYNYPFESDANVCRDDVDVAINCIGVVDETVDVDTRSVRRDYYLIYVTVGHMIIDFDDSSAALTAGDMMVISPGKHYHNYLDGDNRVNYLWMHFTGRGASKIVNEFDIPVNKVCHAGVHHSFNEMWQRMFAEFVRNDKYFAPVTEGILKTILAAFSRYIHSSSNRRSFVRSVTYIHSHYSEVITVAQLADMEHMSEPHYRVCFRKTMGMSPVEYMTEVRIRSAVQLLEDTDKKLEEISRLCGYNDMYYFIRVFKKKTGVTPGRYRGRR